MTFGGRPSNAEKGLTKSSTFPEDKVNVQKDVAAIAGVGQVQSNATTK